MSAAEERSYCPKCNAVFRTPFARCPLDGAELTVCEGDPLVGSTLDKRSEIEECIGEGGMGRVYRAKHVRMSRQYAIKVLFGDHAGNSRMRSRFAREAEAVSRLSHVNVIAVVDFGETPEGLMYLVMDLANGQSLADLVLNEAPLAPARAMDIISQLLKGLAHAHGHGLVHRDFKCENVIMVYEEGREVPKIVDFGICIIVEEHPSATMLTSSGMVLGTPAVMAPEQASGGQVDHRTDLFSLGIVGYQMLSGHLPFDGTPLDMARKNLYETIPSIQERSGIPVAPEIQAMISRFTEKNPDQRFQSANEALEQLATIHWQGWTTPTPPPVSLPHSSQFLAHSPPNAYAHTAQVSTDVGQTSATPLPAMHTQLVGGQFAPSQQLSSRKSRKPLVVVGVLLLSAVVAAAVLSGDDTTTDQLENTHIASATDEPDTDESTETHAIAPAPTDAAPVDEPEHHPAIKPQPVVEVDLKKIPEKIPPKPDRQKKRHRPTKANKTVKKSPEEVLRQKIDNNIKLYERVGTLLKIVKKEKGDDAVRHISNSYNAISRTRLGRNAGLQSEYSGTLKRLQRQLRKKQKQK